MECYSFIQHIAIFPLVVYGDVPVWDSSISPDHSISRSIAADLVQRDGSFGEKSLGFSVSLSELLYRHRETRSSGQHDQDDLESFLQPIVVVISSTVILFHRCLPVGHACLKT